MSFLTARRLVLRRALANGSANRIRPFAPSLPAEALDQLARVETVVPDVEVALAREAAHRLAVLAHAVGHDPRRRSAGEADVAAGDLDARRHPLDVPLPRSGQRLVEVVRAEDEPAVGGREPPKFEMWASPHACTTMPESGVAARSAAITAAAPR